VKTALGKETLVWFGAEGGSAYRENPLPLAMLPEGNLYRDRALAALRAKRRDLRIACVSESIAGLHAMTAADNAVTVLSSRVTMPGMRRLGPREGLPTLRGVELVLWQRRPGLSDAALRLARHIDITIGQDRT
ncbi:MAG: LysR family transcriptional regulator, partial [Hyphomicrobiales bacterium]